VFAAADVFVFRPLPYDNPSRLVVLDRLKDSSTDYLWPPSLPVWRTQRDLFSGVEAHKRESGSLYLTVHGVTERISVERVTPELFALLGVAPAWGRPFTAADMSQGATPVVIIAEALARRLYGDPALALHRPFPVSGGTLTIAGVMPASFRFPDASEQIWRPLDLDQAPSNIGVNDVARLAPGQTLDSARRAVTARSDAVARRFDPRFVGDPIRVRPLAAALGNAGATSTFAMLLGAAACLLLIACGNVAGLELAAAARRVRTYAVQSALGASQASLVYGALLEGVLLLGASAAAGITLARWGTAFMAARLTPAMQAALTRPLTADIRVVAFTLAAAVGTWLVTALPPVWRIARLSLVDSLRNDPRVLPATRGVARSRRILLAWQVALTTFLLVGALLYLRTYLARAGLDTGFHATNIATIEAFPAPELRQRRAVIESAILARLRATPWVLSAARTDTLPPSTTGGGAGRLNVEGRESTKEWVYINMRDVDPEYFRTMGIDIVQGRAFDATTPKDEILVDERFARRYGPNSSPVGARFTIGGGGGMGLGGVSNFEIVGVTRQSRNDRATSTQGEQAYVAHIRIAPDYHPLKFVARLDDGRRVADLAAVVRAVADRSVVRVDTLDARYARLDASSRLAATVTSGFGLVALLVAMAGMYAVAAFLVAGRSTEIAIRMAMGADRRSVRVLVRRWSLAPVTAGILVGLAAAAIGVRLLGARIPAIGPTDPVTYLGVAALVATTAFVATWWPARRAARIDAAVTLKSQ
jgi:putative ABC transport system permease protein